MKQQFRSSAVFKSSATLDRRMITVRRSFAVAGGAHNQPGKREGMKGFPSFAAHLVPSLLVIGLASFGRPCVAQEADAPSGSGSGSVFAPSGYLEVNAPLQKQVASEILRILHRRPESTGRAGGRPYTGDKVSDDYSQLHVLLGSLPAGSISSRRSRQDSPTAMGSTSSASTAPWGSPSGSSRSPSATCMSDGFCQLQERISTAIAVES